MTEIQTKPKSDLGVRTLSAIVMVIVAGGALWAGGLVFQLFVGLIAIGLLWEFWGLVAKITASNPWRMLFLLLGIIYVGIACFTLIVMRSPFFGVTPALIAIGAVIATDVGAYFSGRTFGGPKIAPSISPSKTWSGLLGGMLMSGLFVSIFSFVQNDSELGGSIVRYFATGAFAAIIAQAGDFAQSWMKRKAGVKDSGQLIPGHGGLFDRADGMIAVLFMVAVISAMSLVFAVD